MSYLTYFYPHDYSRQTVGVDAWRDYDTTILSDATADEKSDLEAMESDEKYEEAVELVLKTGQASISMLQRKLRVGYNRAARMIEAMEVRGIVGPSDGVRPRDVYGRKEI